VVGVGDVGATGVGVGEVGVGVNAAKGEAIGVVVKGEEAAANGEAV